MNTDTRLEILAKSLMAIERSEPSSDELRRALSAGSGHAVIGAAVPGSGAALRPQSLEPRLRRHTKVSKREALAWLKSRYPGLTDEAAERILATTRRNQ